MDRIFRALSDRNRLRIFVILMKGPLSVTEICSVLGLTQSNVSHHLKVLLDAGLVMRRQVAGWAVYSILSDDTLVGALASAVTASARRIPGHAVDMRELARAYEQRGSSSREFFDRVAASWTDISSRMPDPGGYMESVLSLLGNGGVCLEVGCGTGAGLPALASRFHSVLGVDSSTEMLSRARKAVAGFDDRVELRLGEAEHLPLADSIADAALLHMVLHHLGEPSAVFPELVRVVKPGGRIVIAELTAYDDADFRLEQGDMWPGFEPEQMESWAAGAGFTGIRTLSFPGSRVFALVAGIEEEKI
jgi:ArsR family transcriptional regulator